MIPTQMKIRTDLTETVLLNPQQKGLRAEEFERQLSRRIVGQQNAVNRMTELYQVFLRE